MIRFLVWLTTYALAVASAAWLVDGIWFEGPVWGESEWQDKLLPLLAVALIMGLVKVFVEPLARLLSLPFIVITLGLFLFVVNALMLMLTGWLADRLGVGFHVDGFWPAVWGSIVITVVTGVLDVIVEED